ncbi:MAG: hypothetical protein LC799_04465 [Actinobacteria bacterium]|nr:hypothetical protein [Actinomycetota bacterium]
MAILQPHVVTTDQEYASPYSNGLMPPKIMATGLSPTRAFPVAEVIEARLQQSGPPASRDDLRGLALQHYVNSLALQPRAATAVPSRPSTSPYVSDPFPFINRQARVVAGSGGKS